MPFYYPHTLAVLVYVRVQIQDKTTRFSGKGVATNLGLVIDLSFKSLRGFYKPLIVHVGLILKQKRQRV